MSKKKLICSMCNKREIWSPSAICYHCGESEVIRLDSHIDEERARLGALNIRADVKVKQDGSNRAYYVYRCVRCGDELSVSDTAPKMHGVEECLAVAFDRIDSLERVLRRHNL